MDSRKVRRALLKTVGKSDIFSGPLLSAFTLPAHSHDACFPPLSRFAVYFCHPVPKSHCDSNLTGPVPCSDTCNDCLPSIYNALRYELVRN